MTWYVVVTGTGTGVGKTVATAALAAAYQAAGVHVGVVKPMQTGVGNPAESGVMPAESGVMPAESGVMAGESGVAPGEAADVDEIARLAGVTDVRELVRLPDPLAPDTAARLRGRDLPSVAALAGRVTAGSRADVVLVEGAGGLLVRLDCDGGTVADLAAGIRGGGHAVDVVVVTAAGLGTLNHTELTVEALRRRGWEPAGLVIGAWPETPELAERCNRDDLPAHTGVPLLGVLPDGAGALPPAEFRRQAPRWVATLP